MACGSWDGPVTNRFQVCIDTSVSGGTVSVTYRVRSTQAVNQTITLVRTGAISGSVSVSLSHGSSGGTTSVTYTTSIAAGQTLTFGASLSGVYNGASPSVSGVTASRGYVRPEPPSNVVASRVSDTATSITWTRHPSSAAPYQGQQLRRRYLRHDGTWTAWVTRANLQGGTQSYTDTHTSNNRLEYAVRAENSAGVSSFAYSNPIETAPAAPGNFRVSPSMAGNELTWTTGAPFPVRTRVERQEDDGPWELLTTRGSGQVEAFHSAPDVAATHRYRARHESVSSPFRESVWTYSERVQLAAPPAAPTGLGPSTAWDATEDRRLTWRHVPTDAAGQERFQVRHRLQGASSWTTVPAVDSSAEAWTLPAGTYSNGQVVEWQVRTWGPHPDPSAWSGSNFQTPRARPTVAINVPASGQVVDRSRVTAAWGYSGTGQQAGWHWQLVSDGDVVLERHGSGTRSTAVVEPLLDGESYTLRVSVRDGSGLWSAWDESTFTVSYVPPQAPSIDSVDWDVELGAAVVQLSQPVWDDASAEPAYHQLWRAIDDGPWLLIEDEIPLGDAVTDPIPAIGDGRVNHYRAVTVSVLPSVAESAVQPLTVPTKGKGSTQGWVYLNAGPGMSQVCRVRANATRSDSEGVAKVLHHFAGRPAPVEYAGTARTREWDVNAMIAPNYDGASTREELVDLQALPAPVCYRDPLGARWFASMGPVASSWRSIRGDVSFSMTEVDVIEGLDVQQRDTSGEGSAA